MTGCASGYFNDGSGTKCINDTNNCIPNWFSNGAVSGADTVCISNTTNCVGPYFSNGPFTGSLAACISSSVTGCASGYFNDGSGTKCINNATECRNDLGFFSNDDI